MIGFQPQPDGTVVGGFTESEGDTLTSLALQLGELLKLRPDDDPALLRLLPDAYDDAEASREFRGLTETTLAEGKVRGTERIVSDLAVDAWPHSVVLDSDGAMTWMKALNDLRLVIASRLGIDEDLEAVDDADVAWRGLYDWLGFVQETLVQAVDR